MGTAPLPGDPPRKSGRRWGMSFRGGTRRGERNYFGKVRRRLMEKNSRHVLEKDSSVADGATGHRALDPLVLGATISRDIGRTILALEQRRSCGRLLVLRCTLPHQHTGKCFTVHNSDRGLFLDEREQRVVLFAPQPISVQYVGSNSTHGRSSGWIHNPIARLRKHGDEGAQKSQGLGKFRAEREIVGKKGYERSVLQFWERGWGPWSPVVPSEVCPSVTCAALVGHENNRCARGKHEGVLPAQVPAL